MVDVVLESLGSFIIGLTLLFLLHAQHSRRFHQIDGWEFLIYGVVMIFIGSLIDITDNFPGLNRFVIAGNTPVQAFLEKIVTYLLGFMLLVYSIWRWLPKVVAYQGIMAGNLEIAEMESEIKILRGVLPICASCKKILDENGQWNQIESYIAEHSEASFTHGICPVCAKRLYPEIMECAETKKVQQGLAADPEKDPNDGNFD